MPAAGARTGPTARCWWSMPSRCCGPARTRARSSTAAPRAVRSSSSSVPLQVSFEEQFSALVEVLVEEALGRQVGLDHAVVEIDHACGEAFGLTQIVRAHHQRHALV